MAAQSSITFRPTLRDVMGRFVAADKRLLLEKRKAARLLGARWVEIAQEEAPEKTGKFRASIRFRTFAKEPREVGFTTSSLQPLGKFITEGTRAHRIYPRRAKALYFFWGKVGKFTVVPKNGGPTGEHKGKFWIGKGFVNHPGTKANNYIGRSYVRWVTVMEKEINAVADRYIVDVVGR